MSISDIVGDLCGFLTIVAAIFLLNAFKDMKITWRNIPQNKGVEAGGAEGELEEQGIGINGGVNNSNYLVDCRDMEARIARNMSTECITRAMSDESDCNDNFPNSSYQGSSPVEQL